MNVFIVLVTKFDCDYCGQSATHSSACVECGAVFCQNHAHSEAHKCEEDVVTIRLPNGSIYDIHVSERFSGIYNSFGDNDSLTKLLVQSLLGSPVTLTFLILMWVWTIFEFAWAITLGPSPTWEAVFILSSEHPFYVWTWVTSIFSHGGVIHIAANTFVLASFGPMAEKYLGQRRYIITLLIGGIIAGVAQIGAGILVSETAKVVGASGAIAAVLGVYATAEPDVEVYFLFIIPLPIWVTAVVISAGSIAVSVLYGVSAFNIAHVAHSAGILFGLSFGLLFDHRPVVAYIQSIIKKVK